MICPSWGRWEPEPDLRMATFTADPPWTAMRCDNLQCVGGRSQVPWRGPLAKCVKDANDYARCPHCLMPVTKVSTPKTK